MLFALATAYFSANSPLYARVWLLVSSLSPDMLGLAYSLVYNGMYMIPEIFLTAIAAVLVARIPGIAVTQNN